MGHPTALNVVANRQTPSVCKEGMWAVALVREGGPHRKQLFGAGGEGGIFWDTRRVPLIPPISLFWGVSSTRRSQFTAVTHGPCRQLVNYKNMRIFPLVSLLFGRLA